MGSASSISGASSPNPAATGGAVDPRPNGRMKAGDRPGRPAPRRARADLPLAGRRRHRRSRPTGGCRASPDPARYCGRPARLGCAPENRPAPVRAAVEERHGRVGIDRRLAMCRPTKAVAGAGDDQDPHAAPPECPRRRTPAASWPGPPAWPVMVSVGNDQAERASRLLSSGGMPRRESSTETGRAAQKGWALVRPIPVTVG